MKNFNCPRCKLEIKSNPNFCNSCGFDLRKITELISKGDLFFSQGKYPEAIECYDGAIKIDSKCSLAWFGKGNVFLKQGKDSEDVKYCVKCYLCPVLSEVFYEDAVKCYNKAIEIDPKFTDALYNKGIVLEKLEKYSDAKKCFEFAKEYGHQE